jgi:hypothetical protein
VIRFYDYSVHAIEKQNEGGWMYLEFDLESVLVRLSHRIGYSRYGHDYWSWVSISLRAGSIERSSAIMFDSCADSKNKRESGRYFNFRRNNWNMVKTFLCIRMSLSPELRIGERFGRKSSHHGMVG